MRVRRIFTSVTSGAIVILLAAQPIAAQPADDTGDQATTNKVLPSQFLDFGEINNTMYEPKSGVASACTGNVVELLAKQTSLDPRFAALIVKEATRAKTDPIAMASLLFWEHRGFPTYGAGPSPGEADGVGRGPWQMIRTSWNEAKYGDYMKGAYDPAKSTERAADMVHDYGGKAGIALGTIEQDFGKGKKLETVATLAKNYNAGPGTWRVPGVAKHNEGGRMWYQPAGAWGGTKPRIIDDYVVGMTYAYYQIATGKSLPKSVETNSFVSEGLSKQNEMKDFKFGGGQANCEANGDIVAEAKRLAWPTSGHGKNRSDAKPPYPDVMDKVNGSKGEDEYSDCGVFVSTVFLSSGADKNYPKRTTTVQMDYLEKNSGPNGKYEKIPNVTTTAPLKPGDILINAQHTYMYMDKWGGNNAYNSVSASLHGHVPEATYFYGGFLVYRFKAASGSIGDQI